MSNRRKLRFWLRLQCRNRSSLDNTMSLSHTPPWVPSIATPALRTIKQNLLCPPVPRLSLILTDCVPRLSHPPPYLAVDGVRVMSNLLPEASENTQNSLLSCSSPGDGPDGSPRGPAALVSSPDHGGSRWDRCKAALVLAIPRLPRGRHRVAAESGVSRSFLRFRPAGSIAKASCPCVGLASP